MEKFDRASIAFSEKCGDHIGTLVINGIDMPITVDDNPPLVIWTSVKKRVFERSKLSVVGFFTSDVSQQIITGIFYLSYNDVADVTAHTQKFKDNFHRQMEYFEETLLKFLEDPNGYEAYLRIKEKLSGERQEVISVACKEHIQAFLREIRVRKKRDDRPASNR